MDKINVGVIGAGRIGKVHAEHLAFRIPEANLISIADINKDAAKSCAENFSIKNCYLDYKNILEDNEINAIVICSVTGTHSQIIEEAASKGKHIFCEKPIDHDLKK